MTMTLEQSELVAAHANEVADEAAAAAAAATAAVDGIPHAFAVGSVFIAVADTDPATLLGYGTWVSLGSGALLSGIATTLYSWKRTV